MEMDIINFDVNLFDHNKVMRKIVFGITKLGLQCMELNWTETTIKRC